MLYDTYQVHSDALAPIRLMAEFFRGVLTQPWPLIGDAPLVRSAAAAMELLSNAGMSHDRPDFGIGEYRYFRAPIPETVDQLRRAVYPHVARVANEWQQLLDKTERFPLEWEEYRKQVSTWEIERYLQTY